MGKILQFKSNELINKFNLCKAAIEDYFDKFFNNHLQKRAGYGNIIEYK